MLEVEEYQELDAVALADNIRSKQLSASEVLECAVQKAQQLNPKLNAIITETYTEAKAQAKRIDSSKSVHRSKLAGVPFLIKDVSPMQGLPQTCSSHLFGNEVALQNANIVNRFVDADLVVLGKTNTPEFCLTITTESDLQGPCRNPWHLDYSTGGSSGGSAAAVAAGIVPAAHATDGGGSIRIPAACCGLVGLKPSRGLTVVDNEPSANWSGMSVGNVVSRSVRDNAAFLDLLKLQMPTLYPLPPQPDSYLAQLNVAPEKLRIALQLDHPFDEPVAADCISAVRHAANLCAELGAEVVEQSPPIDYQKTAAAMSTIINVHVAQMLSGQMLKLGQDLNNCQVESSTRAMAKRGNRTTAAEFLAVLDTLQSTAQQMAGFHREFDIVLSPVLAKPPAPLGWLDMNSDDLRSYAKRFASYSGFSALYNGTGQPSISLPLYQSQASEELPVGLPIGVMFSAAWGQDLLLLQLARQLEQAAPWQQRRPMVC